VKVFCNHMTANRGYSS